MLCFYILAADIRHAVFLTLLLVTQVDAELEIKAYYAGHVLGAAMFQVR